ncbi:MFS transporter [Microbacterium sp. BWT-B31]|uniref:MFS transporter n=1 Tax=Microbacterium sp. BWT-B31 TaxID=3232072 RepID=UPI003528AF81
MCGDGSATPPDRARLRRDQWFSQSASISFSVGQSMAAVAVPLLAVQAGHPIEAVGLIVAVSAISQTVARLGMGSLMSRIPTKFFIIAATLLLAASCFTLALSSALWALIVAQLLQGVARAYFWTGSQTHVLRASDSALRALSRLNVVQGVGQLVGPALAGLIGAWSLQASLVGAGALGMLAVAPSLLLISFAPFAFTRRRDGAGRRQIWRRPGVSKAASMTAVAGAWRGILNSYLPVILTAAGHAIPAVGALVTLTNLASLVGSAISRPVQALGSRVANALGTTAAGIGLAVAALSPAPIWIPAAALGVSGLGAGILQTVGPALAADSVGAEERGRAIASIGTFRSVSLLFSPVITAGLVLVVPSAAVACGVAGIIISTPALAEFIGRPSAAEPPRGNQEDEEDAEDDSAAA